LKFNFRTTIIAFAEDFIVLTRGEYKMETENYTNYDLNKIEKWATKNKLVFNDKNLRFYL